MNLRIGEVDGNRTSSKHTLNLLNPDETIGGKLTEVAVSALMVALDMIHVHKHTKSWALEVVLLTDGELSLSRNL